MLSRVAENLFWIGRYVERAENVARLIDVARRMAVLPSEAGRPLTNEWSSILIAAGARETFGPDYEAADAASAAEHLLFAVENPSSSWRCIEAARENARAIRFALTRESWEVLNSAWSEMRFMHRNAAVGAALSDTIDWVKSRSAEFRGAVFGTMMRDDAFNFLRMGAAVERIDYTARFIDVKYHVLLPRLEDVGASTDHYQWLSLLQAAAGHRAYLHATRSEITARGVAEFLILHPAFPRSIVFNARELDEHVADLAIMYAHEPACAERVTRFERGLAERTIDDIFARGLHEFLAETIEENYAVANALAAAYGFEAFINVEADDGGTTGQ